MHHAPSQSPGDGDRVTVTPVFIALTKHCSACFEFYHVAAKISGEKSDGSFIHSFIAKKVQRTRPTSTLIMSNQSRERVLCIYELNKDAVRWYQRLRTGSTTMATVCAAYMTIYKR